MALNMDILKPQLTALLEKQHHHIDLLAHYLELEKQQVLTDPKALQSIAHDKQAQVEKLEQLTNTLYQLLQENGFAADLAGMHSCLSHFDERDPVNQYWQTLKVKISDCKKANLFNGALLEMNRLKVGQLLEILTQGNSGRSTYDSGGKNTQDQQSNSLSYKA